MQTTSQTNQQSGLESLVFDRRTWLPTAGASLAGFVLALAGCSGGKDLPEQGEKADAASEANFQSVMNQTCFAPLARNADGKLVVGLPDTNLTVDGELLPTSATGYYELSQEQEGNLREYIRNDFTEQQRNSSGHSDEIRFRLDQSKRDLLVARIRTSVLRNAHHIQDIAELPAKLQEHEATRAEILQQMNQ